jgi:hypothetical protein
MILGMSIPAFTMLHVLNSLIAIVAGLVVLAAMLRSNHISGLTGIFLLTTVLTSMTGFLFPTSGFTPAQAFGYLSLVLLAIALAALYAFHLAGAWRWIYVATAVTSLYLNCFVLIVQMFQKLPALHALAPNQAEPPFQIAQGLLLLAFVVLGVLAARRFHPEGAPAVAQAA